MSTSDSFLKMEKGFDLTQAMAEADRCLLCHDAPCSKGCPAGTDPGTFIRKLRMKNVKGAIRTIKQNNVLGGACGVLCPTARLCEKECSATGIGLPIQIGKIQRALVEHGWALGFQPLVRGAARAEKVAIVGSGPAGLSCAAELAKDGFQVTVYEERAEIGGVIRYGVPAYRFDSDFLGHEMADLKHLGVKFVVNTRIDGAKGADKLIKDGFKAVFLAPGLWGAESIQKAAVPKGVWSSVEFLSSLRDKRLAALRKAIAGKTVAVIGGGSVAIDCADSAARLGAKDSYLVYRRSFEQMPAEEDERQDAQKFGVHFMLLNQPVEYVTDKKGVVTGIRLARTRLGEPDASGRRAPEKIAGSEWVLEADVVVEAIGNKPDAADWSAMVKVDKKGLIVTNAKTRKASAKTVPVGVYAGGDIVRGPALVVEAVEDGKQAARAIREALV